jgi:hypothetical protein
LQADVNSSGSDGLLAAAGFGLVAAAPPHFAIGPQSDITLLVRPENVRLVEQLPTSASTAPPAWSATRSFWAAW